jgi:hypothetical protein
MSDHQQLILNNQNFLTTLKNLSAEQIFETCHQNKEFKKKCDNLIPKLKNSPDEMLRDVYFRANMGHILNSIKPIEWNDIYDEQITFIKQKKLLDINILRTKMLSFVNKMSGNLIDDDEWGGPPEDERNIFKYAEERDWGVLVNLGQKLLGDTMDVRVEFNEYEKFLERTEGSDEKRYQLKLKWFKEHNILKPYLILFLKPPVPGNPPRIDVDTTVLGRQDRNHPLMPKSITFTRTTRTNILAIPAWKRRVITHFEFVNNFVADKLINELCDSV